MLKLRKRIENNIVTITDWEDEDKVTIQVENIITNYSCCIHLTHSQFDEEFDELVEKVKQIMKDLNEK